MIDTIDKLRNKNIISAAACYFSREAANQCQLAEDDLFVYTAALLCEKSLSGNVCIDLKQHQSKPFFNDTEGNNIPCAPTLEEWKKKLRLYSWVGVAGERHPVILENEKLYLYRDWKNENDIAARIREWSTPVEGINETEIKQHLNILFPENNNTSDQLPDWQKTAVAMASKRKFAVISGGPGTGKTTTVVKLLALLLELDPATKIALATPTGKAAARLSESISAGKNHISSAIKESIPSKAVTLHRLLGYGKRGYRYNRSNPLPVDCLVIDEASMVDLSMMARVMDALADTSRLILLGDKDQLSSVEAGSILGDITGQGREILYEPDMVNSLKQLDCTIPDEFIGSDTTPDISNSIAILQKSYRFDRVIGTLAKYCNAGDAENAFSYLVDSTNDNLHWINVETDRLPRECINWAVEHYQRYLKCRNVEDALDAFEQARLLCATRKGAFGVEQTSQAIELSLQKRRLISLTQHYHGKPILITRNDQEMGLSNGDIGLIWLDQSTDSLRCYFRVQQNDEDGQPQISIRGYSLQQLPEHELAYCLTVHKSQGSEYQNVLIILPPENTGILTRELIYTGITRTSKRLSLCSSTGAFRQAVHTRTQRTSGLAEKIGWCS